MNMPMTAAQIREDLAKQCKFTHSEYLTTRYLLPRDAGSVLDLEQSHGHEFAWDWRNYANAFQLQHIAGIVMTAERQHKERNGDKKVVAALVYMVCQDHAEIQRLVIQPNYEPYAGLILDRIVSRTGLVQATVSERDLTTQKILRAHGFKAIDVLRRHFDNVDDAYLMQLQQQRKGTEA